jgi:chloramphenicol-sensitive protein RarD
MRLQKNNDSPAGLAFAVSAYVLWGFLPLYMKLLDHIPALEIVAHRVIWSVPIAGLALLVMGRTSDLRAALSSPQAISMGAVAAALIAVNWGIYVWAISSGHALDAALGYYINPLFSIALGTLFMGERPNKWQIVAIALATSAVVVLTWSAGKLPWVAIGLFTVRSLDSDLVCRSQREPFFHLKLRRWLSLARLRLSNSSSSNALCKWC